MTYKLIFTSDGEYHALDQVRAEMPEPVFPCFKAGLERLAADPCGLGRRSYSRRPGQARMFYRYPCDWKGRRYWFAVYFLFDEEEEAVIVEDVVMTVFDAPV